MAGPLARAFRQRSDPNVIALLSLKLLLLAFFILLNSLSVIEEDRQRLVIESVSEAFNGRNQAFKNHSNRPAGVGELAEARRLAEELADQLQSALPAVRVAQIVNRGVVRVEFAASTLFAPRGVVLKAGHDLVLRRLIESLTDQAGRGTIYSIEIGHGVPDDALDELVQLGPRAIELQRAGNLAAYFAEQGIPADRLAAGLLAERPGSVALTFRMLVPEDSETGQDEPDPVGAQEDR